MSVSAVPDSRSADSRLLKQERPHSFRCHGRPSVNTLKSELSPPFFSPPPPLAARHGLARRGFNANPQAGWPSHLVRSRKRCESDRVADRPFALHSEAPDRSGWSTRLAPSVRAG